MNNEKRINNFTGVNINSNLTQPPAMLKNHHDWPQSMVDKSFVEDNRPLNQRSLPSYIIVQMRKDLVGSNDIVHLVKIISTVRDLLKQSCGSSKKSRKDTFKLFFNTFDLFSISDHHSHDQSLVDDSLKNYSKDSGLITDFVERVKHLSSDVLNYQFMYLVNVMACEPIGIDYLGLK